MQELKKEDRDTKVAIINDKNKIYSKNDILIKSNQI